MSSRKKLTISLVSVALVIVAVVVAVVAVLAAQNQAIKSSFSVKYSAQSNVVMNVKSTYKLMDKQTASPDLTGGTAIGAAAGLEIARDYTGNGVLGTVGSQELKDEAGKRALVFAFTFENKGSKAVTATLAVKSQDEATTYTDTTLGNANMVAKYFDGTDWDASAVGASVVIGGASYTNGAVVSVKKTVYVQFYVNNPDFDVAEMSFQLLWSLESAD